MSNWSIEALAKRWKLETWLTKVKKGYKVPDLFLHGGQATGKSLFCQLLGKLLEQPAQLVQTEKYVTWAFSKFVVYEDILMPSEQWLKRHKAKLVYTGEVPLDAVSISNKCKPPTSAAVGPNPKDIAGKARVRITAMPSAGIIHGSHAMMHGVKKYDAYNWRAKDIEAHSYVDAIIRHVLDWFEGEECAGDSGAHHLGHAIAGCAILLDAQEIGCLIDDRPTTPKSKAIATKLFKRLSARIEEFELHLPRKEAH